MNTAALLSDECARHGVDAAQFPSAEMVFADKDTRTLARHLNAIVPVSFAAVGEDRMLSCYPCLRAPLEMLLAGVTADALFSAEVLGEVDALLRPYLAEWGYRPSPFAQRYGISCLQDDAAAVPAARILPLTRRLTADDAGLANRTSMKLSDCAARGAFACIADGYAVCVASVNRVSGAERCVEIGVECAPEYRRRGYALSCVCALTQALCADGLCVLYRHYSTNVGSAAVARGAGFVPAGRFFTYTAFP